MPLVWSGELRATVDGMHYFKSKLTFLIVALAHLVGGTLAAGDLQVLHTFTGGLSDGVHPEQFVVDGNAIYGLLSAGMGYNGLLYQIGTDGSGYQFLHQFSTPDGTSPYKLTLSAGVLYGATTNGGTGGGTVFAVPEGGSNFHVLTNLPGSYTAGATELAVYGSDIYGNTYTNGANNLGTVYHLGIDGGGYVKLHDFDVQAANVKGAPLLSGSQLYGATEINGANGLGTIYRMATDGSDFTVLHSFGSGGDGTNPEGGVIEVAGELYGSTQSGGLYHAGVIYRMNLDGSGYTVLHDFTGGAGDGGKPFGSLQFVDGRLYGISQAVNSEPATYFSLALDGSAFEQEYQFTDGSIVPSSTFFVGPDTIYGVSSDFGSSTEAIFAVHGIPEPSSAGLALAGAVAIAGGTRRARRFRGR